MSTIKERIEEGNTIIVIDTNVLLGLYRHSPQWTDFGLKCLDAVSSYIVLPYAVKIEYENHYRALFSKVKERISKYDERLLKCIASFESKLLIGCDEIDKLHFPDVSRLKEEMSDSVTSMREKLTAYSRTQEALEIINRNQSKSDVVYTLFESIVAAGQTMSILSIDLIYQLCEEGKKRYKSEIPPGFKDAKSKDGVRKYSDFIIWHEIIQYAKSKEVDVIFVTDDAKSDWWESTDSGKMLHSKLSEEFSKRTQRQIEAFTSETFFSMISRAYSIPEYDTVETILSITAQAYGNELSDNVFEKIADSVCYNPEQYIESYDEVSMSEGFEIDDGSLESTFVSAEFKCREDDMYIYLFKYRVKIMAESYEYWGRDEDTKDIILSPANWHTFEGIIEVEVIRTIEDEEDAPYETSFDSIGEINGELEQTEYAPYSFENDFNDDFGTKDQGYGFCPRCGKAMTIETDALNGFCVNCPDPD